MGRVRSSFSVAMAVSLSARRWRHRRTISKSANRHRLPPSIATRNSSYLHSLCKIPSSINCMGSFGEISYDSLFLLTLGQDFCVPQWLPSLCQHIFDELLYLRFNSPPFPKWDLKNAFAMAFFDCGAGGGLSIFRVEN